MTFLYHVTLSSCSEYKTALLAYLALGVTIQHSVDVVRLLIFPYMTYKSHLTFFFQVKKSVNSRI